VFNETLTALERQLAPAQFLLVHRGHIVNLTRIALVSALIGGVYELELKGGAVVRTGRQYADAIRKLLKPPR
jgi:DNA-binding LytR/AlgR family response regulator